MVPRTFCCGTLMEWVIVSCCFSQTEHAASNMCSRPLQVAVPQLFWTPQDASHQFRNFMIFWLWYFIFVSILKFSFCILTPVLFFYLFTFHLLFPKIFTFIIYLPTSIVQEGPTTKNIKWCSMYSVLHKQTALRWEPYNIHTCQSFQALQGLI